MNDIAFFGHDEMDMVKLDLPTQIFTERLRIQKLRYEEAEEIFYSYASKAEATRFMSWPTHQSLSDTTAFLQHAENGWKAGTDYSFSIRLASSARLIGSFGIINENGKLQFGYIYSPTQWGNGYATEVCKAMMQVLQQQPGVYRIQTFTDVDNIASAKVLLKSGLIEEARLSHWYRFVNQNDAAKDCIHFRLPLPKVSLSA
jgi:[ribosomal protein S5]-alanine N-acetyltransferase